MSRSVWILHLLYCCSQSIHGTPAIIDGKDDRLRLTQEHADGNKNECFLKPNQRYMEILPGIGWDNLVNEERGPVIDRELYTQCRNALHGRYIIPDDMFVEPRMSSMVDLTSEVIESSDSFTSLTASSVNIGVAVGSLKFKISGHFSKEKETFKTESKSSKGSIVRSQLRHKRYTVKLLPDSTLHPRFRNRMLEIAAHLRRGKVTVELIKQFDEGNISQSGLVQPSMEEGALLSYRDAMYAFYRADLVVRDYGTHVIQSVDAGGIFVKTDTLDRYSKGGTEADSLKLSMSAAAEFAWYCKTEVGVSSNTEDSVSNSYSKQVVHSQVASYGGPIFRAHSMNLSEWELGLDNQLVVIDRSGSPIDELITSRSLPELDNDLALRLSMSLKSAVERYYTSNVVIGCMDETSIHYDENANVAASECTGSDNYHLNESQRQPLGGIFQRCSGPEQLCHNLTVRNPATGNFTCPEGYFAVQLLTGQVNKCQCKYSWWRWNKCYPECAITELFWCSLDPTLPASPTANWNAGFVFGGIYTDDEVNLITRRYTCPENSWHSRMGRKMRLCLFTDRQLAGVNVMRFGGLYSCRFGNPLAEILEGNDKVNYTLHIDDSWEIMPGESVPMIPSKNALNISTIDSTNTNVAYPTADHGESLMIMWPRRCPNGFTAHLVAMEDICAVHYCVPTNVMENKEKRHLKQPPFIIPPSFYRTLDETSDGPLGWKDGIWVSFGSAEYQHQHKISVALGGTLAVVLTVVLAICAFVMVLLMKRPRQNGISFNLMGMNTMNGD